jgi:superfamily II DNA or RNA helicase
MKEYTLRYYQEEAKEKSKLAFHAGMTRQLMVLATGTGKRLMAVDRTLDFKKTLFLCHTDELITQAYNEFSEFYSPIDIGIIKGPVFEPDKKIVIASAQTIWRRLDKMDANAFDFVIADEVHHYLAPTFIRPLEFFNMELLQGYTATPTRLDGLNFSNIFDDIVYTYDIKRGIDDKFLCELDAIRIKTMIDIKDVPKTAGDFNSKHLSAKVDTPQRNELVVRKYQEKGLNRQGVVFCVDIDHAVTMRNMFRDFGIEAEAVHSEMPLDERRLINHRFKSGRLQILTNVNILTEGWDYSDLGIIMMARPTMSLALYMQMIGRGTRIKSEAFKTKFGVDHCTILDFVDNVGNHRLINTWTLDNHKKPSERTFVTSQRRNELIIAEKQREARIKSFYKNDKKVNLFELPVLMVSHTGRMREPATEKQIDWLKSEGVWQEGIEYTKGQASEFITNFPAKDWMIRRLAEWGYNVIDSNVTAGQYYDVKRQKEMEEEPKVDLKNYKGTGSFITD